ncbi:MAG TPA: hypothetical protein VM100_09885 [Longimicrobiales bacterium]|nr:hypothetical protein [Longimicrobiales bacterium]
MRKGLMKLGVVMLAVTTAAFVRWSADPSAVVVQISGGVQVQRVGQSAAVPASVGLSLVPGDKVIVGSGAKATLLYKTGKMVPVSANTTIEDAQRDQPGGLFKQTVTTLAQVATTNARTQPNRQGMIRPIQGEPAPISPRNSVKVGDLHPGFIWFKVADATSYIVQIRRVEPFASRPERFTATGDTTWSYPSNATPLIPGAVYEWTVASANGGRPASPQRFRVMGADDFTRVAGTMNELIAAGVDPLGDGLFLTALAYRDAGLMYDASRMLDRLEANGAKGKAYYLLRAEVFDALGNIDAATKAFATADAEPNI